jgi:hypothetical protein
MTHPVHATGPNKRACTTLIEFSVHCALQFSSYSVSWGAPGAKTIMNASERLRTRPNGEPKRIGSWAEPSYLGPDRHHWRTLFTQHSGFLHSNFIAAHP